MGGYNAANSSFGQVISKSPFTSTAKIDCIKNNPQYLYASFAGPGANDDITNVRRFDFTNNAWSNISHSGFSTAAIGYVSRGFALNPTNENDYWVFSADGALHMLNDQEVSNQDGYGARFHPDVRAAVFTNSGDLFIGTDGNICKTVFNGNNPYWIPKSEGLNASQAGTIAVTQQAPYYVYSAFWHCGFQIYNPLTDTWKYNLAPLDGSGGFSNFLNKDRYFCLNTNSLLVSLKNFNTLTSFIPSNSTGFSINKLKLSSHTASSENITGRIYGINFNYSGISSTNFNLGKSSDEVNYSNNDYDNVLGFFNGFTAGTSGYDYPKDSSILTFPAFQTKLYTIPNQPDLLMVLDHSKGAVLHLYSGMNATNPTPVLEKTINLRTLFQDNEIGDIRMEFDHRKNNVCWITLKGRPIWSMNEPLRVIEFNYITEAFEDLTHPLDRPTTQSSASFPGYVATSDIAMDRQTGVLYLSTSEGIFYLDRVNEIWRRYSDNVPYFKSSLEIIHCLGEIYTATSHRGIWKAELIRNQDTPTIEWNVTQNETWNNRMNLFCTLVIEPNVTLTIKDELKVYGGQKIIVKPGGHLVLDGGIITSECGDWWEGIEVWGNPAVSQNTPTNQGRLTTKNNAVIEHAHEAISVWKPNDWNSMGGIVNCSNTTFRNNWRSCAYMPYHFYTSSSTPVEYPNKGIFNKCNFVWDDDYFHSSISCGISMYHVNGVSIRGCNFRDLRTGTVADRPNGITSIDAGYSVLGIDLNPGPWNNPNIDYYFDSTDFIIGTFENLENGVSLMSSNTTFPIKVDHTKFKNCNVGVLIDAMDQAIVTRNYFENTTTNPQANQEMYQLVFRNATDYTISGNLFNNSNVWGALGVGVYNSGMDDNAVYDNKFDGLNEGIYAYGFNSNDYSTIDDSKGLVWKCNEFDHGYIDLIDHVPSYSSAYDGEGVKLLQGTINSPIGNLLSTGITSGGAPYDEHLYHTDQDLMGYFYYDLNAIENPTERWGNIAANGVDFQRDCPSYFESTFVGIGQVLNPTVRSNVEGTLGRIETSIQDKTDSLNDLLFDGNRPGLYSLVAGINLSNRSSVHTSLLSESPYLSQSLLEELGEVDPAIYPHDWYRDLIIENSEVALNPDFIQFLSAKAYPLPDPDLANVKLSRFVHTTARGEKEMEIMQLKEQKEYLYTLLINDDWSDSVAIDWSLNAQKIIDRGHEYQLAELVNYYLAYGATTEALAQLDSISAQRGTYSLERTDNDMEEFILYNSYIFDVLNTQGKIDSLSPQNITDLNYMADEFTGRAARQARNVLCFFLGECEAVSVMYEGKKNSVDKPSHQYQEPQKLERKLELGIYPNPNEGTFALVVPEGCVIAAIEVVDVNGRSVPFEEYAVRENTKDIKLVNPTNGILLVNVTCKDGSRYVNRLLISK